MAKLIAGNFELNRANHNQIVKNLINRTREFIPSTVEMGANWYPSAQKDAEAVGEGNVNAGAAAISRLSGTRDYQSNRLMGLQLMHVNHEDIADLAKAYNTDKELHPIVREQLLAGSPLSAQTTDNILRAASVVKHGAEPESIFNRTKRNSNKLPDFHVAVRSGGTEGHLFPIDTHAYDAALDDYLIKYGDGNEHMKRAGVYPFMQSAYLKAHEMSVKQGLVPKDTTPAQYQAMHWLHHQFGKAMVNNRSRSMLFSGPAKAESMVAKFPELNPESKGLDPIPTASVIQGRLDHFAAGTGEAR